jgi:hypothetical protein
MVRCIAMTPDCSPYSSLISARCQTLVTSLRMSAASHKVHKIAAATFCASGIFRHGGSHVPENGSQNIYVSKGSDILEALCNLTYLICEEANHPNRVRRYAGLCEDRLEAMRQILQTNNID